MTPEGLERLMLAIDNLYGVDYPPCANCGHAPKKHGRAAMQCLHLEETGYQEMLQGSPEYSNQCSCDCYDEPNCSICEHPIEDRGDSTGTAHYGCAAAESAYGEMLAHQEE